MSSFAKSLNLHTLLALLVAVMSTPVASWSQPAAAKLQFEVASVKQRKGPVEPHGVALLINHGTLTVDAGELRQIIGLSFGIQRVLVRGCPDWCDEDKFDIVAKTDLADVTRDQIRTMLQALLAERFQLAVYRKTKEVSGYALGVAPKGPNWKSTKRPRPQQPNVLGQPVRAMTELKDRYNFNLDFRPPADQPSPGVNASLQVTDFAKQLALRLQPRQMPTDVLPVDRAQRPSENGCIGIPRFTPSPCETR